MGRPVDPRLLRAVPSLRGLVVTIAAVQAVAAVLVVVQLLIVTDVVVAVFGGRGGVGAVDAAGVATRLVLVALAGLGRAGLAALLELRTARASVLVRARLRRETLDAVVRLGPGWTQRQPTGRVVNVVGPGLDALDGWVTRALPALVSAAVVPPVLLATILGLDWRSGVTLLVLLPLVPVFMALIGMTTARLVQRQHAILARLSGQFLDLLRGLTTLRVYGRAEAQERTLHTLTESYRRHTVAALRIAFLSGLVLDLVAVLSVAVIAVELGLRLDSGGVPFATALGVLLLAPELFAPLRAVGAQHHAAQDGTTAAAAALDIIDEAQTIAVTAGRDGAGGAVRGDGTVALRAVSVTHPGRTAAALRDVDLDVTPGQVVVLTGPSGAGKSTLLDVVRGALAPGSGRVLVGGSPACPGGRAEDVAWLPQRPRPSRSTVADEVRLGAPDADDDTVREVCLRCTAPDPSHRMGEDGVGVSAGQRRRIALARALLRAETVLAAGGVPVVVLDEPSEDLDRVTEQVVAAVISSLAGRATVLVATHSPALLELADVRVSLRDGAIVEVGAGTASRPVATPVTAAGPGSDDVPGTDVGPGSDVVSGTDGVAAGPAPARVTPTAVFRLRTLVRESRATRRLAGAAALSAAGAVVALALAACSLWLIGRAAQHPNVQALALAVVGVRTFALSRALLRYAERLVTHDAALRMLVVLRGRVFAGLRPLPPSVVGGHRRGDLLRRFVGDVDGAQEGLVRAVVPATGAAAGAIAATALAAVLVPAAGGVLAVGLVLAGVLVPAAAFRAAGDGADLAAAAGRRDARCAGLVDALPELAAYGAADRAVEDVARADAQLARAVRRPSRAAAAGVLSSGSVAAITLAAVLAVAADAAARGALAPVAVGVLLACVLTGVEAVAPLPSAWVAWSRCRAGLLRVTQVLSSPPAVAVPPSPAHLPGGTLGLRAQDLATAPAPGSRPVLTTGELRVDPRCRIVITGPSGCGKSTLLSASLRLLPVSHGSLAVTGSDGLTELADLTAETLPPAVAGSLQGDHVFDATLRDNLRLVRPGTTDTELDDLAARMGLLGLVRSLPLGWSSAVGPDGAALSGGQRQRLLVARALLADPAVLVLDEPTAHLDAATGRLVLDDILDATAGRAVLMTTHRRTDLGGRGGAGGPAGDILAMTDHRLEAGAAPPVIAPFDAPALCRRALVGPLTSGQARPGRRTADDEDVR